MSRKHVCLAEILNEVAGHNLGIKEKNRPVKNVTLIQHWLSQPNKFSKHRLPNLISSWFNRRKKILRDPSEKTTWTA